VVAVKVIIELDFIDKDGTAIFDELDEAKRVVDAILAIMLDADIEVVQALKGQPMQIGTPLPPYPPGIRTMGGSISSGDTYILHNVDAEDAIAKALEGFKNDQKRHHGYL
jgi:hypothetical protein